MGNIIIMLVVFLLTASLTLLLIAPCYLGCVLGLILHYGPQNMEYFFDPYYLVTTYAKLIHYWFQYSKVLGTGFILNLTIPPVIGLLLSIFILNAARRVVKKMLTVEMRASGKQRMRDPDSPQREQSSVTIEGEYRVLEVKPPKR